MESTAVSRRSHLFGRVAARVALISVISLALVPAAATAASASLLPSLVSSVASVLPSCAATPTVTPFQHWGDSSSYFLMPSGDFESGATGWTTSEGVAVANENESYFVNNPADTQSLAMSTNQLTISPTVCVAMGENTIRLFVKNPGVAGSVLHIQAFVQNPLTGLVLSTGFDLKSSTGTASWSPTSRLLIPNLLGGVLGTQRLTLAFSTSGVPAKWNIDDVYVDPFKSR